MLCCDLTQLSRLDLLPVQVIESGTGSGNMSMSLARAVSPNGQIFTFEYNASRAEEAAKEFARYLYRIHDSADDDDDDDDDDNDDD
jgi:tRNA A58 N-methylase Trm61